MHTAFKRLFRIQVRHGWYADGRTRGDFDVVPTPSTAALLEELGLRIRAYADGLTVFGEVEPDSIPAVLRRPFGDVSLRFAFEVRARNTALAGITEALAFRRAQTIFCFDNLRADIVSDRAHLGDGVAEARMGPAVTLVTGGVFTYALGAPAVEATITIRDRFGATVATLNARSPDPSSPLSEYRLDLAAVPQMVPGRYEITDDQGGAAAIYYDPGLASSRPAAVIEIYTGTVGLAPGTTDLVPVSYRFIAGDAPTGLDYYIQLDALATTWRYLVRKKYANNDIKVDELSIVGPIVFTRVVSADLDRAVFSSSSTVPLSAALRGLKLRKQMGIDVRDLPEPDLTTPLAVATVSNAVSDMFVYV